MGKFTNQDEYELEIGVPDDMDADQEIALIKTKIQFIRSFKKYYDDLAITSERNKDSLEKSLIETQKLFENLNGIWLIIIRTLWIFWSTQ